MSRKDLHGGGEGPGSPLAKSNTGAVTRADLADAVQRKIGCTRTDSAKCVELVLGEIFDAIVNGEDVKLTSFGTFSVRAKRERQGRNPKTGVGAKITARQVVTFKPSNILKARVNGELGEMDETN